MKHTDARCFITGDPRISILEDKLPDGIRSTLIIREAHDKNFGAYNCSVINAYGADAAEIVLRKQSSYFAYCYRCYCINWNLFVFCFT